MQSFTKRGDMHDTLAPPVAIEPKRFVSRLPEHAASAHSLGNFIFTCPCCNSAIPDPADPNGSTRDTIRGASPHLKNKAALARGQSHRICRHKASLSMFFTLHSLCFHSTPGRIRYKRDDSLNSGPTGSHNASDPFLYAAFISIASTLSHISIPTPPKMFQVYFLTLG